MKETPVLRYIMKAIGCLPWLRIWRNNTGLLWSGQEVIKVTKAQAIKLNPGDIVLKQAYPVRFGLTGSADLLGIMAPDGRFIALEVKQTKGKQSKEQKCFEDMITAMGGVYIVAHSPEEALEKLNAVKGIL